MSYKCPVCKRTFSKSTPYSQHVQKCLKQAESISDEESSSSKMDTQSVDNENDNAGVIIFFLF
jgi:transposase-like protein